MLARRRRGEGHGQTSRRQNAHLLEAALASNEYVEAPEGFQSSGASAYLCVDQADVLAGTDGSRGCQSGFTQTVAKGPPAYGAPSR